MVCGVAAYVMWGLFPLYWPLLKPAGAGEILAHRIMWSLVAVVAVLAGASGPTMIAEWAALKEEFLASVLPLPHGAPCKDVFRRVLMALKPETFQGCFAAWLRSLRDEAAAGTGVERPTLAIDGKTSRRSHDRKNGLGALHSVTAWASEYGLSLGQVACGEKSNEITAIPELLKLVDVSGGVVTIDAMGCQKEIAGAVVAAKGDYVLALKGNQETLHRAAIDHLMGRWEAGFEGDAVGRRQAEETAHGRRETRTYIQLEAPESLPGFQSWRGLKSIGVVVSEAVRDGKAADEVRWYISSLPVEPDAQAFAHAIRSHWGIENGCHWTLDVTFREDESRIREQNLRQNMAWLNRFSLSLLRQVPDRKSVAARRRSCGWSDEYLMHVLVGSKG